MLPHSHKQHVIDQSGPIMLPAARLLDPACATSTACCKFFRITVYCNNNCCWLHCQLFLCPAVRPGKNTEVICLLALLGARTEPYAQKALLGGGCLEILCSRWRPTCLPQQTPERPAAVGHTAEVGSKQSYITNSRQAYDTAK